MQEQKAALQRQRDGLMTKGESSKPKKSKKKKKSEVCLVKHAMDVHVYSTHILMHVRVHTHTHLACNFCAIAQSICLCLTCAAVGDTFVEIPFIPNDAISFLTAEEELS